MANLVSGQYYYGLHQIMVFFIVQMKVLGEMEIP